MFSAGFTIGKSYSYLFFYIFTDFDLFFGVCLIFWNSCDIMSNIVLVASSTGALSIILSEGRIWQMNKTRERTYRLVLLALLTALVVVLQLLGSFIHIGMFSISLVLIPIVVGAVIAGPLGGAWLGLVFGVVVLFTDAGAFLAISVPGTVIVVLLKGILCGLAAGLVYRLFAKRSKLVSALAAAVTCPIVNTGVFILGTYVFFLDTVSSWATEQGMSATAFIFLGLVGVNFILELVVNIVLSPIVVRILELPQLRGKISK